MSGGAVYQRAHRYKPLDAAEVLRQKKAAAQKKRRRFTLAAQLAGTALLVFLAFGCFFGLSVLQGNSMFPNLKNGDLLLLWRLNGSYQRGDLVLFTTPDGQEYVKRVVAVAGDVVDLDEKGHLLVNGQPADEPEIFYPTYPQSETLTFPEPVQEGTVFLLGDYRINSEDSRAFGAVQVSRIVGRVLFVFRRA